MGLSSKLIRALQGVYDKVEFCVKYDNYRVSGNVTSHRGVKQGCILSPILFNLFINDIVAIMVREGIEPPTVGDFSVPALLYADDLILCSKTVSGLQRGLDRLEIYCREWGLTVNAEKTKVMTFKNGYVYGKNESWSYAGQPLDKVKSFVYLGLTLTMTGKWNQHIERTKHKARIKATETLKIRSRIPDISTSILTNVYNAVVRSTLSYGAEIWGWDNTKDLNQIQTYFLKCLTGVGRSTANSGILKEFGTYRDSVDFKIKTLKYYLRILHGNQSLIKAACYREQRRLGAQNCWLGVLQKGLDEIGMGFILHEGEVVRKNVWRKVKKRLIDINRQEIEGDCREKITLEIQTLTSINWGKETYLEWGTWDVRRGLAWLRLGVWRVNSFKDAEGRRTCPLCGEEDSWLHILANCSASEDLRQRYLPNRFNDSNRGVLASCELLGKEEWLEATGKFLSRVRHRRENNMLGEGVGTNFIG